MLDIIISVLGGLLPPVAFYLLVNYVAAKISPHGKFDGIIESFSNEQDDVAAEVVAQYDEEE